MKSSKNESSSPKALPTNVPTFRKCKSQTVIETSKPLIYCPTPSRKTICTIPMCKAQRTRGRAPLHRAQDNFLRASASKGDNTFNLGRLDKRQEDILARNESDKGENKLCSLSTAFNAPSDLQCDVSDQLSQRPTSSLQAVLQVIKAKYSTLPSVSNTDIDLSFPSWSSEAITQKREPAIHASSMKCRASPKNETHRTISFVKPSNTSPIKNQIKKKRPLTAFSGSIKKVFFQRKEPALFKIQAHKEACKDKSCSRFKTKDITNTQISTTSVVHSTVSTPTHNLRRNFSSPFKMNQCLYSSNQNSPQTLKLPKTQLRSLGPGWLQAAGVKKCPPMFFKQKTKASLSPTINTKPSFHGSDRRKNRHDVTPKLKLRPNTNCKTDSASTTPNKNFLLYKSDKSTDSGYQGSISKTTHDWFNSWVVMSNDRLEYTGKISNVYQSKSIRLNLKNVQKDENRRKKRSSSIIEVENKKINRTQQDVTVSKTDNHPLGSTNVQSSHCDLKLEEINNDQLAMLTSSVSNFSDTHGVVSELSESLSEVTDISLDWDIAKSHDVHQVSQLPTKEGADKSMSSMVISYTVAQSSACPSVNTVVEHDPNTTDHVPIDIAKNDDNVDDKDESALYLMSAVSHSESDLPSFKNFNSNPRRVVEMKYDLITRPDQPPDGYKYARQGLLEKCSRRAQSLSPRRLGQDDFQLTFLLSKGDPSARSDRGSVTRSDKKNIALTKRDPRTPPYPSPVKELKKRENVKIKFVVLRPYMFYAGVTYIFMLCMVIALIMTLSLRPS